MHLEKESTQRLGWMDVLRGLLIISVVIGHSTGTYNQYIYQFHMGAFFLVSGYMSRPEKRSVWHTIYHRFLTTYLPVLSATVLLVLVLAVMNRAGIYSMFLGNMEYIGIRRTIEELIRNNNLYVWWLGAAWFMLVLFGASVVNRLILWLCGDRYNAFYAIASVLLYVIGYELTQIGNVGRSRDLVLVAQFYFAMGTLLRRSGLPRPEGNKFLVDLLGLVFFGAVMWLVASKFGFRVDYPDRSFNHPVIDAAIAVNGGLFCYFLARILSRNMIIDKLLQAIGRNTLPIVLFHFLCFNAGFALLYVFAVVPLEYLQNFTPTEEIGKTWWPLFTVVGVLLSILLWKLMMAIPPLRYVFGQEKGVYQKIWNWISSKAAMVVGKIRRLLGEKIDGKLTAGVKLLLDKNILILLCCAVLALSLCSTYVSKIEMNTVGSSLDSCKIESGIHDDGWCETTAALTIQTGQNGTIHLEGWYGQPLTGGEEIIVLSNSVELVHYALVSDTISFDIPAAANSQVSIVIKTNFSYPATPPDTRDLSFIITVLEGS